MTTFFDVLVNKYGLEGPLGFKSSEPSEPSEGCPQCHQLSGYAGAGRESFGFCIEHRCLWRHVQSPWSVTQEQVEKQRERWASLGLDSYDVVRPWSILDKAA